MRQLRRALRFARAGAFVAAGGARRARRRLDGSCAAVLMYHRVLPAAEASRRAVEPGMYVTPETFARHLAWLAAGFRVLPLHEIVSRLSAGRSLPDGACAITFDDGWRDNHDFALPALERARLPATLFAVTERVGSAGAFWPDEVCRRLAPLSRPAARALLERLGVGPGADPSQALLAHLKTSSEPEREALLARLRDESDAACDFGRELLDWDELGRLADAGVDVESHGASHAILTRVPAEDAARELRLARERLRERGHGRHGLLAYPSGAFDETVMRLARDAGYRAAVTTRPGLVVPGADPFALPRVGLHDDVSRTRVEFRHRFPGSP